MAYVDWVYVLPEARHKGVAQGLFQEMEKDCRKHGINQYYLIRATNPNADKFYHSFENAELDEEPFLRKELKDKRTKNNGKIIFPLRRDGQFEIC